MLISILINPLSASKDAGSTPAASTNALCYLIAVLCKNPYFGHLVKIWVFAHLSSGPLVFRIVTAMSLFDTSWGGGAPNVSRKIIKNRSIEFPLTHTPGCLVSTPGHIQAGSPNQPWDKAP